MKAKTALASIAMLSFALAQPAAAAANSSAAPLSSAAVERTGSIGVDSEATSGGSSLWLILAALGLTALLVVLLNDGSRAPVSP